MKFIHISVAQSLPEQKTFNFFFLFRKKLRHSSKLFRIFREFAHLALLSEQNTTITIALFKIIIATLTTGYRIQK